MSAGNFFQKSFQPYESLALLALGHLGAGSASFASPLDCIARSFVEGGRSALFRAYEWNKMKTPTRIIGGDVGFRADGPRAGTQDDGRRVRSLRPAARSQRARTTGCCRLHQ